MSALIVRILTCDGVCGTEVCPAEYGGELDVPDMDTLRRAARTDGWVSWFNGRDYCPDCKGPWQ